MDESELDRLRREKKILIDLLLECEWSMEFIQMRLDRGLFEKPTADKILQAPVVMAGGRPNEPLRVYKYGTNELADVYCDPECTIPHSQPIIADSRGVFNPIFYIADMYVNFVYGDVKHV